MQAAANGRLYVMTENQLATGTTRHLVVCIPDGSQSYLDLGLQQMLALNVSPDGNTVWATGMIPVNGSTHLFTPSLLGDRLDRAR